jgi:hypothetical protein
VCYYIKYKELKEIMKEKAAGTIQECPTDVQYLKFWKQPSLVPDESRRQMFLDRAREFIKMYMWSLYKHNEQFTLRIFFSWLVLGRGRQPKWSQGYS